MTRSQDGGNRLPRIITIITHTVHIVIVFVPSLPPCSLHSWLVFLYERAPPLVFGLLAAGPCLSGLVYVEGSVDWEKFAWGLIGMMVQRNKALDTNQNTAV